MPYNIKNETKKDTEWMEKCVDSVMSNDSGKTKSQAIAICKVQLKKKGSDSEVNLREELWDLEAKIYNALGVYDGLYIADIYDEYVIIEYERLYYRLYYAVSGNEVTFNWDNVTQVERKTVYEPVAMSQKLTKKVASHGIIR